MGFSAHTYKLALERDERMEDFQGELLCITRLDHVAGRILTPFSTFIPWTTEPEGQKGQGAWELSL